MTPEPLPSQAPDDPAKCPEHPPLEQGRVTATLRRLLASALQRKEIDERDALDVMLSLDYTRYR